MFQIFKTAGQLEFVEDRQIDNNNDDTSYGSSQKTHPVVGTKIVYFGRDSKDSYTRQMTRKERLKLI